MVRVIFPLSKKKKKKKKKKSHISLCLHNVYHLQIQTVSTKLGQNIYVQLNFNEFDHGSKELFALEFGKIATFDFVYTLASTNINQSALNLVTMNMSIDLR